MRPQGVASVDPPGVRHGLPQRGRLTQLARAQVEAHQRRKGLLRRPALGAAAAYHLPQPGGGGQVLRGGGVGDRLHPPLDQGEDHLQAGQRRGLFRRGRLVEDVFAEGFLQACRIHDPHWVDHFHRP